MKAGLRVPVIAIGLVSAVSLTAPAAHAGDEPKMVSDELGTRQAGVADVTPAKPTGRQGDVSTLGTGTWCTWQSPISSTDFNFQLLSGWTELLARQESCRAAPATGTLYAGYTYHAYRSVRAEFICRGRSYGYGSDWWFRTSLGWSWSGGTTYAVWNVSC